MWVWRCVPAVVRCAAAAAVVSVGPAAPHRFVHPVHHAAATVMPARPPRPAPLACEGGGEVCGWAWLPDEGAPPLAWLPGGYIQQHETGEAPAAAAPVPEPTSVLVLLVALAALRISGGRRNPPVAHRPPKRRAVEPPSKDERWS